MRSKAIQDFAHLSDDALFAEVEAGATLCTTNAKRIHEDSRALVDLKRIAGAEILRLAAQEEASKVLILLDAVRCPRATRSSEFGRQLQYFNRHLPKGIYSQYCGLHPASFGEVRRWVDLERKDLYLDGPNGVDWIFYNDILRRREETIYVDYVANDDGAHYWHDPRRGDDFALSLAGLGSRADPVLRLVSALSDAGCFDAGALQVIADIWRVQQIDDDWSWHALRDINSKTLEEMKVGGLLKTQDQNVCSEIVNEWLFPLYGLDLGEDKVNKDDLREVQRNWWPD
jgi:AbiV family abortive infection protein